MEAHDVLHDAYRRGKSAEAQGKNIHNPHAWLKSTALNIIRERSRAWSSVSTDPQIIEELLPDETRPEQALIQQEEVRKLQETISILAKTDPDAFRLLYLRTIREYSWQEISDLLSKETGNKVSDVALRQQLSRAKKKFRAILHDLDESNTERS
jgi:RNA polymerase sigma factor (sigma-70 family)